MRSVLRLLAAILLGLPLLAPSVGHAARSGGLAELASASCNAPLSLTLQPGQNWPGGLPVQIPSDLPPGPVTLSFPLYPGATPTDDVEAEPFFSYPAVDYMKSASATYHTSDAPDAVQSWYEAAFKACGYATTVTGSAGGPGGESAGVVETETKGTDSLWIDLSFADTPEGGTVILYVAIIITPPQYPVAGSILRVPGNPVAVSITGYSGLNPGPIRPIRSVNIHDAATVAALADEINHLPKVIGSTSCPMDDGSHDTLVFTDADGTTHPVYVGLRGCQVVAAPPAPAGRLADDPHLLPRIDALLQSSGSTTIPYPFDARNLRAIGTQRLGSIPGRFLSTGQNGANLLYLSHGRLYMAPASGGTPKLLATDIADASFVTDDEMVVARPRTSHYLRSLVRIDTATGKTQPFHLPGGAVLVGRSAGDGSPGLSDAESCDLQYLWFVDGRRLAGIDPLYPSHDRFSTAPFLPPPTRARRLAISCSGINVAIYQPGTGLTIRNVGFTQGRIGSVLDHLPVHGVTFLTWAPDDRHLLYRSGATLFVLDVQTGKVRRLMGVGADVIHGAAWDPFSRVIALSITSPSAPPSNSHILLANVDGHGTARLALPFSGAGRLEWSSWKGSIIGLTQTTRSGTQAWAVSLPPPPADPGVGPGG